MTRSHSKISWDSLTKISISNEELSKNHKVYNQTQICLENYCAQFTVRRQSDLFSKKTKNKFQGGSFFTVLGYLPERGLESRKTWPMDVNVRSGA